MMKSPGDELTPTQEPDFDERPDGVERVASDRPPGQPSLAEQRAEIAQEPGNHGRFALGCAVAVAVVLAAFFALRLFVLH